MNYVELLNENLPESFKMLLQQYAITIEKYATHNKKDCGYWYSERPNISILASAASKINYLPLEELSTTKSIKDDDKSANWKGRIDLKITDSINEIDFLFEAKHTYTYKKELEKRFECAINDCQNLKFDSYVQYNHFRCAILFHSLCYHLKSDSWQDNIEQYTKNPEREVVRLLELYKNNQNLKPDALVYYYTEKGKEDIPKDNDSYYYPGIITLFKIVNSDK